MSIRLGVNIDHIAALREERRGQLPHPDLLRLTEKIIQGGADNITLHLKEDHRSIKENDLATLAKHCSIPLTLEIAPTNEMVRIARRYRPEWVCFVPENRQGFVIEKGLNVDKAKHQLTRMIERLQFIGIEVSTFIEPSLRQVKAAYEVGADAIEIHTGAWVCSQGKKKKAEWNRLNEAASYAHQLGLGVHVGYGLDLKSVQEIAKLDFIEEVHIGHWLFCQALEIGIEESVRQMKFILQQSGLSK